MVQLQCRSGTAAVHLQCGCSVGAERLRCTCGAFAGPYCWAAAGYLRCLATGKVAVQLRVHAVQLQPVGASRHVAVRCFSGAFAVFWDR